MNAGRNAGVVVVGGGQAGFETASALRSKGYAGPVTIVSDEPGVPYQRPPLSKAYLHDADRDDLDLRPRAFYDAKDIALVCGEEAVAIDRDTRHVLLASGQHIPYDHLVLATGAGNRPLPVPGADLPGVSHLRTDREAEIVRHVLHSARSLAVVGAGFIGLEVAAAARAYGLEVDVVEFAERPMARAVSSPLASWVTGLHERHGVRLHLGAAVREVLAIDGHAAGVRTTADRVVSADAVVVGVGVLPRSELARGAGLEVGDGIVVDERLRTTDPRVFAIGDCAAFPGPSGPLRLESVQNAVDHARCVAAQLTGVDTPYSAVPWFWTQQFDAKIQMAGLAAGHASTQVRGREEESAFSVLCFDAAERLVAVESVNRPRDHMAARHLLARPLGERPGRDELCDEQTDLKQLVRA